MRQQALWHWLRRCDSARAFFAGHAPAADVVSVKDALHAAVAPMLAAGLGKALREGLRSAPCHALLWAVILSSRHCSEQQCLQPDEAANRYLPHLSGYSLRDTMLHGRGIGPPIVPASPMYFEMRRSARNGLLMQMRTFVCACCLCIRRQPQKLTSCLGSSLGAGGRRGRRGSSL